MNRATFNAELVVNGPVHANGPVYVQGVDVAQALREINAKLEKIEEGDLPLLKENVTKLLNDFPVQGSTKSHLETIREWIEAGKNLKEIIEFIQTVWVELGPVVTDILLQK